MRQRPLADAQQRISLAKILRDARTAAGLKQVDVADRLGIPQSFVSKWEGGQRRLDLIELMAVCRALDTDIHKLLAAFERAISKEEYR